MSAALAEPGIDVAARDERQPRAPRRATRIVLLGKEDAGGLDRDARDKPLTDAAQHDTSGVREANDIYPTSGATVAIPPAAAKGSHPPSIGKVRRSSPLSAERISTLE